MSIADRLRAIADEVALLEAAQPPAPVPAPEPPAPAPEPPAPEPPAPPPPAPPAGLLPSYHPDDASGPSRDEWSKHLLIPWVNYMGDWIDAAGVPQGAAPVSSVAVSAVGEVSLDVTGLLGGAFLRLVGSGSPNAYWGGRLSPTPPRVQLVYQDGTTETMPVRYFSSWSSSTVKAYDTRTEANTGSTANAAIDFFPPAGPVQSATLILTCTRKGSVNGTLHAYRSNPPGAYVGGTHPPVLGIAGETTDLQSHPDVLRACDFSDLSASGWPAFDNATFSVQPEQITEPDGSVTLRSYFRQGTSPTDTSNSGSCTFNTEHMDALLTDPLRPVSQTEHTMFCRVYVLLEEDWAGNANGGCKMAMGWDMRLGYWKERADRRGGYWQQTTGNGGIRGSGRKLLRTLDDGSQRWEYQGHSIRMEAGTGLADLTHPYERFRPVQLYVYHLDQFDANGTMERFGNVLLERGRWHCIETEVSMNSVVGPLDELGNGEAAPDGVLRLWVDGVLAGERTAMRWRRNMELGVQGIWINWYYGGKYSADQVLHYRMRDFALARRYIGPKV